MRYDSAMQLAYEIGCGNVDSAALLIKVLDMNPTLVLSVVNGVDSKIVAEVKALYNNGASSHTSSYVNAIKYYREQTGTSLKEAKDAVDKIVGRV